MEKSEEIRLCHVATFGTNEESTEAMKKLREVDPTYRWCCDWDFLVICDSDPESRCCGCKKEEDESKQK